jgi:hypothetical protein
MPESWASIEPRLALAILIWGGCIFRRYWYAETDGDKKGVLTMATIDWTADSGKRAAVGIKSFVQKQGGVEYHVVVLDEALAKAYGDANSITYDAADVYKLIDVKKGDLILGGFTYVEVAGGVAGGDSDWGITGIDIDLMGTMDPDNTAGTLVNETAGPYTSLVDDSLDLVSNAQLLISTGSGRWRLGVAILPVAQMLSAPFVVYTGDPNTTPQT